MAKDEELYALRMTRLRDQVRTYREALSRARKGIVRLRQDIAALTAKAELEKSDLIATRKYRDKWQAAFEEVEKAVGIYTHSWVPVATNVLRAIRLLQTRAAAATYLAADAAPGPADKPKPADKPVPSYESQVWQYLVLEIRDTGHGQVVLQTDSGETAVKFCSDHPHPAKVMKVTTDEQIYQNF